MDLQSRQKSLGGEGSIVSCRHYDQPSHKKELMLQFQVRRVKGFRGVLFHIMIMIMIMITVKKFKYWDMYV